MWIDILLFAVGLLLLYVGAEGLVGGASALALRMGIKPLVVGLTVVAFGTSAPELVVSLVAVFEENDAISIGNILGSNIANMGLILGVSALIRPLEVRQQAVRREYPIMLGASVLLALLLWVDVGTRDLSRLEGGLLLAGMIGYLAYSYYSTLFETEPESESDAESVAPEAVEPMSTPAPSHLIEVGKLVGGVAGLTLGAFLMVESATSIAEDLGISPIVIGITVVAFGTSLPELATSVLSAVRQEADISVGNVIGSNLFNILMVLGIVAMIYPLEVDPRVMRVDVWVMLVASLVLWPILRFGKHINRLEGGMMVIFYAGYVVWLFIQRT